MLEGQMERVVANCSDLFIEPGLSLLRWQVVINGRRPDLQFSDVRCQPDRPGRVAK